MYGDLDGYYLSCVKGTAKDGFAGIASATMEELERDTCIRRIASQEYRLLSRHRHQNAIHVRSKSDKRLFSKEVTRDAKRE